VSPIASQEVKCGQYGPSHWINDGTTKVLTLMELWNLADWNYPYAYGCTPTSATIYNGTKQIAQYNFSYFSKTFPVITKLSLSFTGNVLTKSASYTQTGSLFPLLSSVVETSSSPSSKSLLQQYYNSLGLLTSRNSSNVTGAPSPLFDQYFIYGNPSVPLQSSFNNLSLPVTHGYLTSSSSFVLEPHTENLMGKHQSFSDNGTNQEWEWKYEYDTSNSDLLTKMELIREKDQKTMWSFTYDSMNRTSGLQMDTSSSSMSSKFSYDSSGNLISIVSGSSSYRFNYSNASFSF